MTLEANWCTRQKLSKWCKKKREEGTGLGGAYLGFPGCYRPADDTVCLGIEYFTNLWFRYENDQFLAKEVANVICHEEDHRAIYHATKSVKATLHFDWLFTALYDFKKNREWFRLGGVNWFGNPMRWKSLKEREEYLRKKRARVG